MVDVPGHERFVRQMIAGSTGIDLALLCIAADDGVMPQTEEHLAVLELLGIRTLRGGAHEDATSWTRNGPLFMADEVRGPPGGRRLTRMPVIVPVSSAHGRRAWPSCARRWHARLRTARVRAKDGLGGCACP